jgi:hypothetical protein
LASSRKDRAVAGLGWPSNKSIAAFRRIIPVPAVPARIGLRPEFTVHVLARLVTPEPGTPVGRVERCKRKPEASGVVIADHFVGYVSWMEFQAIQAVTQQCPKVGLKPSVHRARGRHCSRDERAMRRPDGPRRLGPVRLWRYRIRDTASDQPHKKPGQHKSAEQHGPITHVELKKTAVCCSFYVGEHDCALLRQWIGADGSAPM